MRSEASSSSAPLYSPLLSQNSFFLLAEFLILLFCLELNSCKATFFQVLCVAWSCASLASILLHLDCKVEHKAELSAISQGAQHKKVQEVR